MLNFKRGLEPKDAMGTGTEAQIKNWILKNNPDHGLEFEVKGHKVTIKKSTIILKNLEDAPVPDIEFIPKNKLIVFDEIPVGEKLPTFTRLLAETISKKKNKTFNINLTEDDLQDFQKFNVLLRQILKENSTEKITKQ